MQQEVKAVDKLKVSIQKQDITFQVKNQQLIINVLPRNHSYKASGRFGNDVINEMTDGLMQSVGDVMDFVQQNKGKRQIMTVNEDKNMVMNFTYTVGKKEKTKNIIFMMKVQTIDESTMMKIQNEELTKRVQNIQNQFTKYREEMEQKMAQLQNRMSQHNRFDQLHVRGITFQNGWRMGYYQSDKCFGIMYGQYPSGYWLRKGFENGYRYLQTE